MPPLALSPGSPALAAEERRRKAAAPYRVLGGISGAPERPQHRCRARRAKAACTADAACTRAGAAALLAGAYAGPTFAPGPKSAHFTDIFTTANNYHLVHSAVLALAPAASAQPHLVRATRRHARGVQC